MNINEIRVEDIQQEFQFPMSSKDRKRLFCEKGYCVGGAFLQYALEQGGTSLGGLAFPTPDSFVHRLLERDLWNSAEGDTVRSYGAAIAIANDQEHFAGAWMHVRGLLSYLQDLENSYEGSVELSSMDLCRWNTPSS